MAFHDTGLFGNREYSYTVSVRTVRDERVESTPANGRFHALVDSWPLDLAVDANAASEYIRLDVEHDQLLALVARRDSTQLLRYSLQGELLTQTRLLQVRLTDREEVRFDALTRLNGRLLMITGDSFASPFSALVEYDANGAPVQTQTVLVATDYDADGVEILPWLAYQGNPRVVHRQLALSVAGDTLLAWAGHHKDPDLRLTDFQVGVTTEGPFANDSSLLIGGDGASRFLMTWTVDGLFQLDGYVVDEAGNETRMFPPQVTNYRFLNTIESHFTLTVEDGQVRVESRSNILWSTQHDADYHIWSSAARLGTGAVFTSEDLAYDYDGESLTAHSIDLPGAVSDTRVWRTDSDRFERMGMAMATADFVQWGTLISSSFWGRAVSSVRVGPHLPDDFGSLFYPLSLVGSRDERVYVLDAGNSRVLAFDSAGNAITQWGEAGTGADQFDFGGGAIIQGGRNLRGSIAVDDQGFIYVADAGNGRIKKYAP